MRTDRADDLPFQKVALIGLGLIGSSIARSVRETMPTVELRGYDSSADVCRRVEALQLLDSVAGKAAGAVSGADLAILCVPVGAMAEAARSIAPHLAPGAIV